MCNVDEWTFLPGAGRSAERSAVQDTLCTSVTSHSRTLTLTLTLTHALHQVVQAAGTKLVAASGLFRLHDLPPPPATCPWVDNQLLATVAKEATGAGAGSDAAATAAAEACGHLDVAVAASGGGRDEDMLVAGEMGAMRGSAGSVQILHGDDSDNENREGAKDGGGEGAAAAGGSGAAAAERLRAVWRAAAAGNAAASAVALDHTREYVV